LADQGQLNHFLRRGEGEDRNYSDLEGKKDNGVGHNMEIISTIVEGIDEKKLNAAY